MTVLTWGGAALIAAGLVLLLGSWAWDILRDRRHPARRRDGGTQ